MFGDGTASWIDSAAAMSRGLEAARVIMDEYIRKKRGLCRTTTHTAGTARNEEVAGRFHPMGDPRGEPETQIFRRTRRVRRAYPLFPDS
jgi:hypothetical protein